MPGVLLSRVLECWPFLSRLSSSDLSKPLVPPKPRNLAPKSPVSQAEFSDDLSSHPNKENGSHFVMKKSQSKSLCESQSPNLDQ